MSIGIVLPSALHELGIKIGADFRQSNKFHVSTSYKNAKSMITHMDRPRQISQYFLRRLKILKKL